MSRMVTETGGVKGLRNNVGKTKNTTEFNIGSETLLSWMNMDVKCNQKIWT